MCFAMSISCTWLCLCFSGPTVLVTLVQGQSPGHISPLGGTFALWPLPWRTVTTPSGAALLTWMERVRKWKQSVELWCSGASGDPTQTPTSRHGQQSSRLCPVGLWVSPRILLEWISLIAEFMGTGSGASLAGPFCPFPLLIYPRIF